MDLVKYAIFKPITIAVVVILIVLFGLIGMNRLPVQLTPDVELPEVTVNTQWPGATPYEIEQEIIEKQEEALKSLQNLIIMESSSYNGYGEVNLTFKVGTDLDDSVLRVSNQLEEISGYPENAKRPTIDAAGAQNSPIIWIMLKMKTGDFHEIDKYRTFFEDEIRQYLERVEGVGSLFVAGGTENQLHIILDPEKMAQHQTTINHVIDRIQGANQNESAGVLGIGKKDYRIRTFSQFQAYQDPLRVMIYEDGLRRVFLRDIARSSLGYEKKNVSNLQKGDPVIAIGILKEQGTNVIKLVERVHQVVDELNNGMLSENNLYLKWVYDQTPYINTAINIVKRNVLIGGALAIIVLLIFLRSITSTLTTAIAIPISVIGTFIFLWVFQRNLNVVSLAGISFAVGMLVDNSIVVLENIDRHRKLGKTPFEASYDGTREVLGAVFASTVTTVAVFLPVIFIQEEAGQLFRDIAIAITFSIIISLFVSIAVIPTLSNQFYKRFDRTNNSNNDKIAKVGTFFVGLLMNLSKQSLRSRLTSIVAVILFTTLSVSLIISLLPRAEYLPQGNQNFILSILIPPPGASVEKRQEIGDYLFDQVKPFEGEEGDTEKINGMSKISDMFYVASSSISLFGASSSSETEARTLIPFFTGLIRSIPDMFGVSIQPGIFQSDLGGGRSLDVNISGERLDEIIAAGQILYGSIAAAIPGTQIRPVPSLEISYPEVNILPDKIKLAANGLTEAQLGIYVDVLMDGRKIGEYRPQGKRSIDLILKGDDATYQTPEDILNGLIVNHYGDIIRIGDVAQLVYTQGMTQVDHLERKRTVKLQVTPPNSIPLEAAIEKIKNDIISPLKKSDKIGNVHVAVGGNADKLRDTRLALQWNFLLAVVIIYLLMSALFENFFYPLIILFTVPLAGAGGLVGLKLVNLLIGPQGFDVLTMLGFVILVGTVVNNAILIVYQTLNNIRYRGLMGKEAITEAVRTRIRPIFMSAFTSLFAMLPLVVSTGSGSELYRGLGSVLLGGLAMSTLFTLFVIPALLSLFVHRIREKGQENGAPVLST
ncbi:MAG: efflux RND transporter permease subunit [Thermodesulfobacteriota bacterium]|nr:efflux RND transporter permease subunit [Thermodesulfobacteriota bacterium]